MPLFAPALCKANTWQNSNTHEIESGNQTLNKPKEAQESQNHWRQGCIKRSDEASCPGTSDLCRATTQRGNRGNTPIIPNHNSRRAPGLANTEKPGTLPKVTAIGAFAATCATMILPERLGPKSTSEKHWDFLHTCRRHATIDWQQAELTAATRTVPRAPIPRAVPLRPCPTR